MKSIIQKGIIPARTQSQSKTTNFKPIDHMMYEGQVRSGHNICCLCSSLLELSSCRVTYENCYKSSGFFSIKSEMSGWI